MNHDQRPDENGNLITVAEAVERWGVTAAYPSEASKYLCVTQRYLHGNGLDIGSGGWPITERAIQYELPPEQFNSYTGGRKPQVPIEWHGDMNHLPFKDDTLDFIHCSHVLEDFNPGTWVNTLAEWKRCIKPTGYIVILVPEHTRWQYCVQVLGQCPNCAHFNPEPSVGDMSKAAVQAGLIVKEERLTNLFENDYTILCVFTKQ